MKTKVTKKEKMRDLLCLALNEIIRSNKIDINDPNEEVFNGSMITQIAGKESKISWGDIGFGEVRVTLWWGIKSTCLDSSTTKPLNRDLKHALDACCSGWLERREGKWFQGYKGDFIFDTFCAKSAVQDIFIIPKVETNGYDREGKKYF